MDKETKPHLIKQPLDQIMSDRFGRYSKYIIQDRALPDVRDGLKPVQRRILFAMHELGLTHNKPYKKSARVVGEVIGKFHPHGDSSIYEALVRMSQDWKINMPLISMHGNNGSIDDDPAAAMRYTEARLEKITDELLRGIKKDTVSFANNFDDSEIEPTVLPAAFPNLIINGVKGIAAGYATEMPPHNLGEVIDGTIAMIKSPNIRLDTLMQLIKGPDFPTGGIVQGGEGIYSAFERGRGKIIIRSKVEIIDLKTKPSLTITEIPYGVVKSKLVRDIDEIRFNKSIHGIKEIRDETDRNGISIKIELLPNVDPQNILNYLYSKTDLQVYYNYNNIAIDDRAPKLLSIIELLSAFIKHQKNVQRKLLEFELKKDKNRFEIVSGLVKVADIVDEVIEVIKKSSGSKTGVVNSLVSKFKFSEVQANAIAELKLYRLSSTDQSVYLKEKEELSKKINDSENVLGNNAEFDKYIISKLRNIKKEFAVERKTKIEHEMQKIEINTEELIKHEDVYVGVSKFGYIKSFSNRTYEANKIHDYKLKESDSVVFLEKTNTSSKILVFTSMGRYIFIPCHKIQESKFKTIGSHVNDHASLTPNEEIVSVISVEDFSLPAFIIMVTRNGKAKRTALKSFEVTRHKSAVTAIKLNSDDELLGAKISNGHKNLIIVSSNSKAVKYQESTIPVQGTKSSGVIGISLSDNNATAFALAYEDEVIGMASIRGGFKRCRVNVIPPMSRTTKGKPIYKQLKNNPHYVSSMEVVQPNTEVIYFGSVSLEIVLSKRAEMTNEDSGFSNIASEKCIDVKIKNYEVINKESNFLKIEPIDEEKTFEDAEKKIDSVKELSIDEILNDI